VEFRIIDSESSLDSLNDKAGQSTKSWFKGQKLVAKIGHN